MQNKDKKTTHFGYREVPKEEKAGLVAGVFKSVASNYDIMNDAMSFGMHRLWKKFTIDKANIRPGQIVIDVAAGTGDLSKAFAKKVGEQGKVYMTDINSAMLSVGRDRLLDQGIASNIEFLEADAQSLPFPDNFADCITIAFGLRNVTDKDQALRSMYRVLKPGGKLLILEFSKPRSELLNKAYDAYSFKLIPKMGEWIANDRASYQYLVESIRKHPDQDTLKAMMTDAGFEDAEYFNLTGGIVALHLGYKY